MNRQTRKIAQAFFLIGFCMLIFLQNYALVSWSEDGKEELMTETTGETESESNEKVSENELELEDFNTFLSYSIVPNTACFVKFIKSFKFLSSFLSEGIEFPPEI